MTELEQAMANEEVGRAGMVAARKSYADALALVQHHSVWLLKMERQLHSLEATRARLAQEANAARYAAQTKK